MKISDMTASQINAALDRIDNASSKLTDDLINAGRGHEKSSETMELNDPLSVKFQDLYNKRWDLRREIERRYGPGAPSRLPTKQGKTVRIKNPLYKGYSPDIIGRNIAEALKKGVPHAQAIAVALTTARREYRLKHPTGPFPRHLKMVGKVRGKNPVMKKHKKTSKRKNPASHSVKIIFNKLLGGWYVVTGPHHTPLNGRFNSKAEAQAWLINRENARNKNPVSTLIKVFKHGPGEKKFQKVGYFTGTGWDTSITKAEKYSAGKARELAAQLKIPAGWGLALVTG